MSKSSDAKSTATFSFWHFNHLILWRIGSNVLIPLFYLSDWCGYPTTAVLAMFKVFSLRKFAVIMRPKRIVLELSSEKGILTSYPDEAVKIEVIKRKGYSMCRRLILKVRREHWFNTWKVESCDAFSVVRILLEIWTQCMSILFVVTNVGENCLLFVTINVSRAFEVQFFDDVTMNSRHIMSWKCPFVFC